MCKKLDNEAWEEYLNKFESIKDTITVKDFSTEWFNSTQSMFIKR